ncbi:MAG: discoidin domain-containing protein [Planctomycetes bacterium]|nr:discoidin domain-containing protein [Planctomycetota bacterium]
MCKKLIYLVLAMCFAITSVGNAARPTPVAWWKLDGDVLDSSGNDRNGTLHGNPQFVPGMYDQALELHGNPDYVTIDGYKGVVGDGTNTPAWSVTAWVMTSGNGEVVGWGSTGDGNRMEFRINSGRTRAEGGGGNTQGDTTVNDGQWHHIAMTVAPNSTYDNGVNLYLDGVFDTRTNTDPDPFHPVANFDVIFGQRYNQNGSRWFTGAIDDVRIYDKELTLEEIQEVMEGLGPIPLGAAFEPSPANEVTDVPREVVLSWAPGEFAAPTNGHKVYLGESFNDVNDATGGVAQDANSYTPAQRLDFSTTYYWRVDEVNAPPDSTIFKGEVWSFTTEPVAYAIENTTATASSTGQEGMDPENTINGSGLDANDLHSTQAADMWISGNEPNGARIEYELDKVYKLHEMWVWNSNGTMESVLGLGLKDVTIEYSTNGTDYTTLGTTHEFARAPGTPDYAHNTTVDFGGAAAKYVRLTANSNWGGFMPQYGLSEVRFFSIPVFAREPSPDSGTTDVAVDVTLSFRAGRGAAEHNVYIGTDEQAVIDSNVPVSTVTEASHGPLSLDLGTTYYWKINEVNEAETPTTWQGDIWNFTTPEYFVVDDFEDYNDYPPDEIWSTWIDGYGVPANGATVGHPTPDWGANEHYVETVIVHGGEQAMPFFYDNTGTAAYSEGERTFAVPQNWTEAGVQTLALYFSGNAGNTGQLYVKVNGFKVTYDGDVANITLRGWQAWNIELASFGTNLQNVTTLAIGIDGSGASGTLYFDDIRLYPYSREFVTPVEPNSANLAAHYQLDGNLNDSSGQGRNGTTTGVLTYVAGKIGQAVNLDGSTFVEITGYKGVTGTQSRTMAAWIKTGTTGEILSWGQNTDGQKWIFRVQTSNGTDGAIRVEVNSGYIVGDIDMRDNQWHHVAAVFEGDDTPEVQDIKLYVDGLLDTVSALNNNSINTASDTDVRIGKAPWQDRPFTGQIDDVRIYDNALSYAEVANLAGRTEPFDKPF